MKGSYLERARRKWRGAIEISDTEGRYAVVSLCRGWTSFSLHETYERAVSSIRGINKYGCGGKCWLQGGHYIYDFDKRKKVDYDDDSDDTNQRA